MTTDQVQTAFAHGRPVQQASGWFVSFAVQAPTKDAAIIQAKIAAKLVGFQWTDVTQVTDQGDRAPTWVVELQIEAPS